MPGLGLNQDILVGCDCMLLVTLVEQGITSGVGYIHFTISLCKSVSGLTEYYQNLCRFSLADFCWLLLGLGYRESAISSILFSGILQTNCYVSLRHIS
jgi:hypothetical protein